MLQPVRTINLTTGETGAYPIPVEWERAYLGGSALAARLLYASLAADVEALSPDAPLLFMNGPLSGTTGPAVGRFVVCGRSPLTGLWGEANCGGFWGVELRKCGFDGLWLKGRSEQPVVLWLQDNQVELRPAAHLQGLDTYQTQAAVLAELGEVGKGASVASIGPAGEKLIPYALILTDHGRVAGRTGMGAVMGSKNVKAIAVRGHGKIPVADESAYMPLRSETNRFLRSDPTSAVLRELGTAGVTDYFDYLEEMPKRYFRSAHFEGTEKVSGASISSSILAGISACHACVIACGRVVRLEDGEKRKGPEYETLVGFGPNLGLNDAVLATRLGELCDRLGMDTISMSGTLGLAYRLFEMGLISEADTGGEALNWGDYSGLERLVQQTVRGEGFGGLLAMGTRELGKHFGAEEEAVQVNGLEVAYHDPRGASGMALVYATSPRGACHNQSDYFLVDVGQAEPSLGMDCFDRQGGAEKAANVAIHQNWRTVFNSLVMCLFANVPPETLLELVNAACGLEWTVDDLMRSGERGWNLKRAINNRLGLRRENDRLPKAFMRPYRDRPESSLDFVPDFENMLRAYYGARGWDWESGFPGKDKLRDLGLDDVLKDLYRE